jgi:hypothetical protein
MQCQDFSASLGLRVTLIALVVTLAGCGVFTCTPISIEVASKDDRTRMVSELRGITNDETGRGVDEIRREKLVTEYWVADRQGRSYRVSEAQWRGAEVGQPLTVCH